jgi:RNA polymerase sigma-70 factor (ECF subfamily)
MALKEDQIVEVMLRNRIRLTAFIRAIVCDFHAAEDIFQKVCLSALQSSQAFHDSEHLLKWAWLVCRSESFKYLAKQKKAPVIFDEQILEMIHSESQKPSFLDDPSIYSVLEKCLSLLSSPVKLLLQNRYQHNLTGAELAKVLNRNVKSVYVAISRAHRTLYKCMHERIHAQEYT